MSNIHPHRKLVLEARKKQQVNKINKGAKNNRFYKNNKSKNIKKTPTIQPLSYNFDSKTLHKMGNSFSLFFIFSAILLLFGTVMVFSAQMITALDKGQNLILSFGKQLFIMILSFGLGYFFIRVQEKNITKVTYLVFYLACIGQLLVLITPLGITINGNRNWLDLGIITFQPSEFIKLGVILILSVKLSTNSINQYNFKDVFLNFLFIPAIGLSLIFFSKDAGTLLILGFIVICVLFFIKLDKKKLRTIILICVILGSFYFVASPTKRARLLAVLFPQNCDPQGICYQTNRAAYGMANGGIFGVGLGGSKEKWLRLSEAENDFIFAIIGEELGLIGCLVIIVLFIGVFFTLLKIASYYSISYSVSFQNVFIIGVFMWFFSQTIINIMMVIGIFPVVGIPLPFISAGGSSMMASISAIGILFRWVPKRTAKRNSKIRLS